MQTIRMYNSWLIRAGALSVVGSFCVLLSSPAVADARRPALEPGFLPGDVAARWGSPTDKLEYEVSRGEAWTYPPSTILRFREGRLVRGVPTGLMSMDVPAQRISSRVPTTTRKTSPSARRSRQGDEDVEEILTEIMDNFPSGTDSGSTVSAPAAPAPPAVAPLMGGELYSPDGGPFSGSD